MSVSTLKIFLCSKICAVFSFSSSSSSSSSSSFSLFSFLFTLYTFVHWTEDIARSNQIHFFPVCTLSLSRSFARSFAFVHHLLARRYAWICINEQRWMDEKASLEICSKNESREKETHVVENGRKRKIRRKRKDSFSSYSHSTTFFDWFLCQKWRKKNGFHLFNLPTRKTKKNDVSQNAKYFVIILHLSRTRRKRLDWIYLRR